MTSEQYSIDALAAIYELGRVYLEMGYFIPAERIFNGLVAVDQGQTPARLALGVLNLERGLTEEAAEQFRLVLDSSGFHLQARLGLTAAFLAGGDIQRARSSLAQVRREYNLDSQPYLNALWEAFSLRCEG